MKLTEIENLRMDSEDRRVVSKNRKNLMRFLNYLLIEYAIGYQHLNDMDQEIYAAVRRAYSEQSFRDLRNDMRKIEEDARFLQCLPKSQKRNFDEAEWSAFETKLDWESKPGGNRFTIDDIEIDTDHKFLNIIQYEGQSYAQFLPPDQSYFIRFGYDNAQEDPAALKTAGRYEFINSNISVVEEKPLQISEEEFFQMKDAAVADSQQRTAIRSGIDKNLVVLAGAGSGKTRTLVWRMAYLHLVCGIPMHKILLVTFARDAKEKMREQSNDIIQKIYEEKGKKVSGSIETRTIDGFIRKIVMEFYPLLGFASLPVYRIDEEYEKNLLDEVIQKNHMEDFFHYYYADKKQRLPILLRNLRNYAYGLSVNVTGIDVLLGLYIDAQKEKNVIVDFLYANHMVKEAVSKNDLPLRKRIEEKFQCVLFDEFQDISTLQNETFRPFYNGKMHFTFVGDDDQSIYGWRGSDNEIIRNIVKERNTSTIFLMTNYRNNPNIVNAGNAVLRMIKDRAKTDKEIIANRKSGARLRVMAYDTTYTNLANEVERLIKDGKKSEDICVLCRMNEDRKNVTKALQNCGIPVEGSKIKFDITIYFQLLEAMLYILSDADLIGNCSKIRKFAQLKKEEKYSDLQIRDILRGKRSAEGNLRQLQMIGESMLYYDTSLLSEKVYRFSLKANEVFFGIADERLPDSSLEEFERYCYNNMIPWPVGKTELQRAFQGFIQAAKISRSGGGIGSTKGVTVSTIHGAKGLEYDTVIIAGLNDGECPNIGKIQNDYNRNLSQLNSLKSAEPNYKELKEQMSGEVYGLLLKECAASGFDDEVNRRLANMREELEDGKFDHIRLTGDGAEDYVYAFRENILFIDDENNRNKGLLNLETETLQKKKDAVSQNIEMIEKRILELEKSNDSEENMMDHAEEETGFHDTSVDDNIEELRDSLETKREEESVISREFDQKKEEINEISMRNQLFRNATVLLREHYSRCLQAQGFLEEMKKAERIEILKEQLKKEMDKQENEERRLFYVAVTRAINLLYLCHENGKKPSEFITSIPERFKGNYIALTREQRNDIERTRRGLRSMLYVPDVNNREIDAGVDHLIKEVEAVDAHYQKLIDVRVRQLKAEHPLCSHLKTEELGYVERGFALLALAELTDMEYKTEFVHNMQRAAEVILHNDAGKHAKPFKTKDYRLAKKIAGRIRQTARNCSTHLPSEKYIVDLLTKDQPYNGELPMLKPAGIMHYLIRSGKFNLHTKADATWKMKKIKGDPDQFLCSVIDLANIRNSLIHPSQEKWNTDVIAQVFQNFQIILQSRE